ncbi:hypothetical protein AVEN_46189-1 [Araneus ventricosus]|uniref:Uncharacterized protein n=1 Tax=Araneus ventricosus TaxID=182803 RepID=A0A4Y2E8S5_ARAVE|nr:hypothetical protein AVEN_46189-1 [Araneus ventricosus]
MGSNFARARGRPSTRWLDDTENDIKILKIKNWQRVALDRLSWKKRAVEAAKTCYALKEEGRIVLSLSVCQLAFFDVRAFTDISPEHSSHPANPRATTILCDPTTGAKAYFEQGAPKHGPWKRGLTRLGVRALSP